MTQTEEWSTIKTMATDALARLARRQDKEAITLIVTIEAVAEAKLVELAKEEK